MIPKSDAFACKINFLNNTCFIWVEFMSKLFDVCGLLAVDYFF